ncbi:MAG TPA: GNAT family N-acetyltransferase [Actinomycetota bacterium]|nr:GNAT family N-acetyltransferase [Actinomycetota bacterium]
MNDVRRATVGEVPELAGLLARAFVGDAIMEWTTPEPDREATIATFFRGFDAPAAEHGWLWTTEGLRGVALWVPPGSESVSEALTFELGDAVRELLGDAAGRYDSFWGWAEAARPAEPHWYLDHVAVEASARGSGVGTALVAHGLRLAAADGLPAFLCTSRPDNVSFYERRGFVVERAGDAPDGGPHVWFLRRDPPQPARPVT